MKKVLGGKAFVNKDYYLDKILNLFYTKEL